ncbi:hypothetical protein [Methanosarcina barkeri]|uniref:hypothetical protein n=1 Tax=Methanosarcina barkeri TaxID=2208 RepID=UPI000B011A52
MGETIASKEMHEYFDELEARLKEAIKIANTARARGGDPKPVVEIPLAKDLADRVENLIGVEGVAAKIRALEEKNVKRRMCSRNRASGRRRRSGKLRNKKGCS